MWKGGYYGEDNAVNVHVSNIRKKLAAIDPEGAYVKTVWGIGFKLS
ncbi:MAG: helix-turn-helix domain-containing protein [Gordonibacter sp.]